MILVDSSVWIDYFRGASTAQTEKLNDLLEKESLAVGDLILMEVLQGFRRESEFQAALRKMSALTVVNLGGADVALLAAQNFRKLRSLGITVRRSIDTLIATACIVGDYSLLHSDRDFDSFAKHLGLKVVKVSN